MKITEHFLQRAWERGYHQSEIEILLRGVNNIEKKTLLVFNKEKLRSAGHKVSGNVHLIIVVKKNKLITLFEVPDLYAFLKVNVSKASLLIL